jgi:hypothetical protein
MARLLGLTAIAAAVVLLAAHVEGTLPQSGSPAPSRVRESVWGIFEGRTPCGTLAVKFTGFPARRCEKIKWQLTLYHDATAAAPTRYEYKGTRTSRRGTWYRGRGTAANPAAVVYRLATGPGGRALAFLAVDERVLLLLDEDLKAMVGDASWSYTLNRVGP